jgi:hypothetical protein
MYVDPASFETFRAVREELRKRNLRSGWQPDEVGNEDFGIGSGPVPPIQ